MKTKKLTLLNRSPMFHNESLQSYLARLSILNYYPTPNTVENMALKQTKPYTKKWFIILSQLTTLSELDLFSASYHRWADIFEPYPSPSQPLYQSYITVSTNQILPIMSIYARNYYLWNFSDVSYCPLCIKEHPYHRLHWLPLTSAACLEHKTLLVRGCPSCNQPISINNLVYGICLKCKFPLCKAQTTSVAQDEFGLNTQAILQSLWGDVAGSYPIDKASLPKQKELKELFYFFEKLRRAVVYANGNMSTSHNLDILDNQIQMSKNKQKMSPPAFFTTSATAFKALLNWPNGFHEFLDAFRHRSGRKLTGQYYADFTGLREKLIDIEFAIQETHKFHIQHFSLNPSIPCIIQYQENQEFQEIFPYTTIDEAKSLLQIPEKILDELVNLDMLTKVIFRHQSSPAKLENSRYLLFKDEVRYLSKLWKRGWSLSQTAKFFGISEKNVFDLIDIDLITLHKQKPNQDSSLIQISIQSMAFFLAQIHDAADNKSKDKHWHSLKLTELRLSNYGYNFASIIKAVLEGNLCAKWTGKKLSQLTCSFDSIQKFQKQIHNNQLTSEKIRLISEIETNQRNFEIPTILKKRKISKHIIVEWIKLGVIKIITNKTGNISLSEHEWQRFYKKYAFWDETIELLEISSLSAEKWINNGRLRPILSKKYNDYHHHLFFRNEIKVLSPQNRMTRYEFATELRIMGKQGEFIPISGPGIDNCRTYLFSRDDLKNNAGNSSRL